MTITQSVFSCSLCVLHVTAANCDIIMLNCFVKYTSMKFCSTKILEVSDCSWCHYCIGTFSWSCSTCNLLFVHHFDDTTCFSCSLRVSHVTAAKCDIIMLYCCEVHEYEVLLNKTFEVSHIVVDCIWSDYCISIFSVF